MEFFMKGLLLSAYAKRKNPKTVQYIIRRYLIDIILTTAFVVGMVWGAFCAGNAENGLTEKLDFLFLSDFRCRCQQTMLYSFAASLTANFIFFVSNILFGFSVWGSFGVIFLIGFKGFGISLTGGYMYKYYGFAGVGFFLLVMTAGYVISALALITQGKQSVIFSKNLFATMKGNPQKHSQSIYHYMVNNSFTLIALTIGSMADALLGTLFAGIFNFS